MLEVVSATSRLAALLTSCIYCYGGIFQIGLIFNCLVCFCYYFEQSWTLHSFGAHKISLFFFSGNFLIFWFETHQFVIASLPVCDLKLAIYSTYLPSENWPIRMMSDVLTYFFKKLYFQCQLAILSEELLNLYIGVLTLVARLSWILQGNLT